MSENEYFLAWAYYAAGASVFFAVFWFWTRNFLWSEVRQLMRVMLAVILIVPWYTDTTQSYLSPAWLVSVAEALLNGPEAFWRAGRPLVIALIAAFGLSTIYALISWYLRSRRRKVQPTSAA